MDNQVRTEVAIIGAGISGLTAGHFLKQQGRDICILEKSGRIGGAIRSERRDGFLVEFGPNSILDTTPLLHDMFSRLNINNDLEYANDTSKNRYIVRHGRLNPLPASPLAFLRSRLFSTSAKLRLLKEPFIAPADPDVDESLAGFVQRRLGREFLDYAINPFVAGVYAGKPEALSVCSALTKLHQMEQEYGSLIKGAILGARKRRKSTETSKSKARLFSFRDGLQTLVDALGRDLDGNIFTRREIRAIRRRKATFEIEGDTDGRAFQLTTDALLITVPAHVYPDLPLDFQTSLVAPLQQIYYPPVTMVYFGFKSRPSGVPLDGFGFLVPEKENRQILGTVWSSTIFSNRAPDQGVALTTFVGGSRQPENALLPEGQLIELVRRDIEDLMGIRTSPDLTAVKSWKKAIPQYHVGHREIITQIEQFEQAQPGVFISGNFRGGISVADCVKQSHLTSGHIHTYLTEAQG